MGLAFLRTRIGLVLVAVAAPAVLCASGCLTPFDFAANAGLGIAQAGTSSFIQGTLQSAVDRPMEQVFEAAKRALAKLGYESTREDISEFYAQLQSNQSDGSTIVIKLKKSSPKVTGVSIRVGLWGDNAVSRLIFIEIEKELGITPGTWPAGEPVSQPGTPISS
jgi:hypothetical protein